MNTNCTDLHWYWPFGFFIGAVLICLLISRFWWGWGAHWRRGNWYDYQHGSMDAQEILRQRYAKGEISKEQFNAMKKDITEIK